MRWPVLVLGVWAFLVPCSGQAQTDFSATTLTKGQVVRITDPSGLRLQGVVTRVTPSSLSVDGHVFRPAVGLKVERLGDSIWDGVAIAAAIGGLLGAVTDRTGCFSERPAGCVWKPALVFGVIGGLIDRAHVGSRTVFLGKAGNSVALYIDMSSGAPVLLLGFPF